MRQGIFCQTTAATSEEYRKELKNRNRWLLFLAAAGAAAAIIALLAEGRGMEAIPDYMLGVYCGAGTGILLACLILFVKNLLLLKDEGKLKQSWLENYDERNAEIRNKAVLAAVKAMLIICVIAALVGGVYDPYLIKVMLFVTYVFLFSYLIANSYYKKKM